MKNIISSQNKVIIKINGNKIKANPLFKFFKPLSRPKVNFVSKPRKKPVKRSKRIKQSKQSDDFSIPIRSRYKARKYKKLNPICEIYNCNNKTDHIHHFIPLSEGGSDTYDNFIAVCVKHHKMFHPELPEGFIRINKISDNFCHFFD